MTSTPLKLVSNSSELSQNTPAWWEAVRSDARQCASRIQKSFWDLGKILYNIHNAKDPSDQKTPVFIAWGFPDFYTYVEEELKIPEKTAQRMQRLYFRLNFDLSDAAPESKEAFLSLGFSKVTLLLEVVTLKDLDAWVKEAAACTCAALRVKLEQAKKAHFLQQQAQLMRTEDAAMDPFSEPAPVPANKQIAKLPKGSSAPREIPSLAPVEASGAGYVPTEEKKFKTFALYPEQLESVEAALEASMQISHSVHSSYNLSLICDDFLMTNRLGLPGDLKVMLHYLARVERHLGVRLVAVDANTSEVLYGLQALMDSVCLMEKLAAAQEVAE